jgi:methylthioribose-1-phosphate isomerase
VTRRLERLEDAVEAIRHMRVRGAPLIGATAAYGLALQTREDPSDAALERAAERLLATRPTAVNLRWAVDEMRAALEKLPPVERAAGAYARAERLCDDEVADCRAIGRHGLPLLEQAWERRGRTGTLNVLTHCNAGWLATVDWGTALAPVYRAHQTGLPVHVWVDETRPRNQGAGLTAWELLQAGVLHTVVTDNAGGHLIQHGLVDLCLTGTDRTTARGDVCNKIGTYLKALAAHEGGVPFYVAVPRSSIDWNLDDGLRDIPIEERDPREVTHVTGRPPGGGLVEVAVTPAGSPARNFGFDVTPARLVTALVTERGVCPATAEGLAALYGR